LWHPENLCSAGLDPLYIKLRDSGGVDLDAGGLDAGCWQDWMGLEGVAARWEEGLEENSHTLELEEPGGYIYIYIYIYVCIDHISIHSCFDLYGMMLYE